MTGEVSPDGPGERPLAGQPASPDGELRASHEDRDAVVDRLRVAAGDGRLTAAELDERLELALTARTYRELAALTTDLPAAAGGALARPGPPPQARDVVTIQCGSGHTRREGPWVLPRRIDISVTSGQVLLDLTEAVITGPVLQIDADVRSGHLLLIVRPGIVVDADDVQVTSGHVKTHPRWPGPAPEILRVQVSGRVRSGHIAARPPRRTLWQWLRRVPPRYPTT